jgi:hypothetical protein
MSLEDEIRSQQIRAGEQAVIENLERKLGGTAIELVGGGAPGLSPAPTHGGKDVYWWVEECQRQYDRVETLTTERGQLRQRVAELEAYERRYRWLRNQPMLAGNMALAEHFGGTRLQDFDALIDAAN